MASWMALYTASTGPSPVWVATLSPSGVFTLTVAVGRSPEPEKNWTCSSWKK